MQDRSLGPTVEDMKLLEDERYAEDFPLTSIIQNWLLQINETVRARLLARRDPLSRSRSRRFYRMGSLGDGSRGDFVRQFI